jgi:DNA-binding CsgD family transcriptional regulator/tetratricopeptide (TPR) repeat protein
VPDWTAEYAALSAADADGGLSAEELERLAVAAFLIGADDEVCALRERAHDAYLERGLPERAAECGFWLGFHLDLRGEAAQAAGWAARVRRLIPDGAESRLGGRLRQREAVGLMFAGDAVTALPIFDDCARVAAACGDLDGFVLAGLGRGRCLTVLGRSAEAADAYDEVMVHVVAGRVAPQVTGLAYCAIVATCMEWFDIRRAQEWTHTFAAWAAQEVGMLAYRGTCLVHRAEILQLRGAWPEAAVEAQRACEALAVTHEPALGGAHYRIAELARLQGRFAAADQAYARAGALGTEVQPGLALLRMAQHRPDAAAAGLDRALTEHQSPRVRAMLLAARVEVALAAGDLGTAERCTQELAESAPAGSAAYLQATREHAAGALLLAAGEPAAALPRLRRAWALWQEVDSPYEAARTRVLVARACAALGDEDASRMELAAARVVFEELGAFPDLTATTGEQPPATGSLTAREREVLQLIATGATNRAIADRLVLSEKTVARHVSNLFGKLGVTSRAAATAYAYEHGLV